MGIQGNGGIFFAWKLKDCPKELQNTLLWLLLKVPCKEKHVQSRRLKKTLELL